MPMIFLRSVVYLCLPLGCILYILIGFEQEPFWALNNSPDTRVGVFGFCGFQGSSHGLAVDARNSDGWRGVISRHESRTLAHFRLQSQFSASRRGLGLRDDASGETLTSFWMGRFVGSLDGAIAPLPMKLF